MRGTVPDSNAWMAMAMPSKGSTYWAINRLYDAYRFNKHPGVAHVREGLQEEVLRVLGRTVYPEIYQNPQRWLADFRAHPAEAAGGVEPSAFERLWFRLPLDHRPDVQVRPAQLCNARREERINKDWVGSTRLRLVRY